MYAPEEPDLGAVAESGSGCGCAGRRPADERRAAGGALPAGQDR